MVRETSFDEVHDGQATFRALLDAMSRPGRIFQAPAREYSGAPTGITAHTLSVLKTFCDHRVSFSVADMSGREEWERYLAVNLAAPSRPVDEGDYVIFDGAAYDEAFARLRRGSLEFPEASATAILAVERLDASSDLGQSACVLSVSGPGVDGSVSVRAHGLDRRYPQDRARSVMDFPLGIDLIFVDTAARVVGIPRTSRVEIR